MKNVTNLAKSKCTGTVLVPIFIAFNRPILLNDAVTLAFCMENSLAICDTCTFKKPFGVATSAF